MLGKKIAEVPEVHVLLGLVGLSLPMRKDERIPERSVFQPSSHRVEQFGDGVRQLPDFVDLTGG